MDLYWTARMSFYCMSCSELLPQCCQIISICRGMFVLYSGEKAREKNSKPGVFVI